MMVEVELCGGGRVSQSASLANDVTCAQAPSTQSKPKWEVAALRSLKLSQSRFIRRKIIQS